MAPKDSSDPSIKFDHFLKRSYKVNSYGLLPKRTNTHNTRLCWLYWLVKSKHIHNSRLFLLFWLFEASDPHYTNNQNNNNNLVLCMCLC